MTETNKIVSREDKIILG